MNDSSQIPSSTVIGLFVKDPRLMMPTKKAFNAANQQNDEINSQYQVVKDLKNEIRQTNLAKSKIWCEEYIKILKKSRKTTDQINNLRSNYLMPGTKLNSVENSSHIPVLLVQTNNYEKINNLGNFKSEIYFGWDLIVPGGWGMAFWLPLIHFGARAIAQKEINYLLFESGKIQIT